MMKKGHYGILQFRHLNEFTPFRLKGDWWQKRGATTIRRTGNRGSEMVEEISEKTFVAVGFGLIPDKVKKHIVQEIIYAV